VPIHLSRFPTACMGTSYSLTHLESRQKEKPDGKLPRRNIAGLRVTTIEAVRGKSKTQAGGGLAWVR